MPTVFRELDQPVNKKEATDRQKRNAARGNRNQVVCQQK
jgi:hypothetical protein